MTRRLLGLIVVTGALALPAAAQVRTAARPMARGAELSPLRMPGADDLLQSASRAEAESQWTEALHQYDEAGRLAPERVEPILGQARTLHALGRSSDAATLLERALAEHPDSVPLLCAAGESILAVGSPSLATNYYRRALALAPNDPELRAALGWALHLDGRHAEVVELLGKAPLDELAPHVQLALGRSALLRNQPEIAVKALESWLESSPEDLDAWLDLARARFLLRQDEGVIEALTTVLAERPTVAPAYVLLGHVRTRWGQHELALRAYREAVRFGANEWALEPLMDRLRAAEQREAWRAPR